MRSHRTPRGWAVLAATAMTVAACSSGDDGAIRPVVASDRNVTPTATTPDVSADSTLPEPSVSSTSSTTTTTTTKPGSDDEVTTTAADDGAPAPDDDRIELIWATASPDLFSGLDPIQAFDLGTYAVLAQTVEHLTSIGSDQRPQAALATSWTPNADATVWTFELRPDVTFHDGTPFTSADVVFSLNRVVPDGFALDDIVAPGGIVAVDELTVQISTLRPSFDLPVRISDGEPQTAIINEPNALDPDTLIGTGPFELLSVATVGAQFAANDDWWGGVPTVARLEFLFLDSSVDRAAALAAGEVDGIAEVTPSDLDGLNDAMFTVAPARANNHREIWMRTDAGPFEDVRVRQAFASSIDRQALVDTLWGDAARVANDHPIPSTFDGFDASLPQRVKDDEAARRLLADAGFPDGVDVTLFVGDLDEIPQLASLIADQAASAGFRISVDVVPISDFYSTVWCPDFGDRCNGESFGIVDYGHRPIPHTYLDRPLTTGGAWNASNHAEPTYDAMFTRFESAETQTAAAAAAQELQTYLHDQVPVVIPYFFDLVSAHRSDLTGVTSTALAQPGLANA